MKKSGVKQLSNLSTCQYAGVACLLFSLLCCISCDSTEFELLNNDLLNESESVTSENTITDGNQTTNTTQNTSYVLYAPTESDYRTEYLGDKPNQKQQEFEDYFKWVKVFFEGNWLDMGWHKRCKHLLDGLERNEDKVEVCSKLNALGRLLASDWAKSNSIRKTDNDSLISVGHRLEKARVDTANGVQGILVEIEKLVVEANAAITKE